MGGVSFKMKKNHGMEFDEKNLTKAEREKILEVLYS